MFFCRTGTAAGGKRDERGPGEAASSEAVGVLETLRGGGPPPRSRTCRGRYRGLMARRSHDFPHEGPHAPLLFHTGRSPESTEAPPFWHPGASPPHSPLRPKKIAFCLDSYLLSRALSTSPRIAAWHKQVTPSGSGVSRATSGRGTPWGWTWTAPSSSFVSASR